MQKKISLVLPVYNEKDNLEKTVNSVLNLQKRLNGYKLDIVIADSHSSDGTGKIAKKIIQKHKNVHYINVGLGLGVGLHHGHSFAINKLKSEILVQIDADGQVSEDIIPRLVETIEKGYDLALGSRFVKGGKNELSPVRKFFTYGSSSFCRLVMGPFNIHEFTNSARAFTPELFNKINWKRLPWKRKTFIYMPAFLNEAIISGARYKEIPLVFKNRMLGYSKNKIVNYTLDIVVYSLQTRLYKMGVDLPLFNKIRS